MLRPSVRFSITLITRTKMPCNRQETFWNVYRSFEIRIVFPTVPVNNIHYLAVIYLYTLAVSPSLGVADNTKKTTVIHNE